MNSPQSNDAHSDDDDAMAERYAVGTLHVRNLRRAGMASSRVEAFVPGPIEQLWTLLSDPARLPEWEMYTESVEPFGNVDSKRDNTEDWDLARNGFAERAEWLTRARAALPDGTPMPVRGPFPHRRASLTRADRPFAITWRFVAIDTRRPIPLLTEFELEPAAGGTRCTITASHERRNILRWWLINREWYFIRYIYLLQTAYAVRRIFR